MISVGKIISYLFSTAIGIGLVMAQIGCTSDEEIKKNHDDFINAVTDSVVSIDIVRTDIGQHGGNTYLYELRNKRDIEVVKTVLGGTYIPERSPGRTSPKWIFMITNKDGVNCIFFVSRAPDYNRLGNSFEIQTFKNPNVSLIKKFQKAKNEKRDISDFIDLNNVNFVTALMLVNDELQPVIKKYTIESPQNLVDSYHF